MKSVKLIKCINTNGESSLTLNKVYLELDPKAQSPQMISDPAYYLIRDDWGYYWYHPKKFFEVVSGDRDYEIY